MAVGADEPCPLPTDPLLSEVALAMESTGQASWIFDASWRFVYVSDDARSLWFDRVGGRLGSVAIGDHIHIAGGGPIMGGEIQSAIREAFTLG